MVLRRYFRTRIGCKLGFESVDFAARARTLAHRKKVEGGCCPRRKLGGPACSHCVESGVLGDSKVEADSRWWGSGAGGGPGRIDIV